VTLSLSAIYDRVRDPASRRAARGHATVSGFALLRGHKYCLLVSYRRSGEAVPTPVWFGMDSSGRLYVRTEAQAGKVKRVRANGRVLVAPASARGKPLGPLAQGTARVLAQEDQERAEHAVQANYGLGRRLYRTMLGASAEHSTYLEITAA
jgi:uncharacterized protein